MTTLKRRPHPLLTQFQETMRDPVERERNRQRLVDSITGSLRVEGYPVKREDVERQLAQKAEEQS